MSPFVFECYISPCPFKDNYHTPYIKPISRTDCLLHSQRKRVVYELTVNEGAAQVEYQFRDKRPSCLIVLVQTKQSNKILFENNI